MNTYKKDFRQFSPKHGQGATMDDLHVGDRVKITWNGYPGVSKDRSDLWTVVTAKNRTRVKVLDPLNHDFTLNVRLDQICTKMIAPLSDGHESEKETVDMKAIEGRTAKMARQRLSLQTAIQRLTLVFNTDLNTFAVSDHDLVLLAMGNCIDYLQREGISAADALARLETLTGRD